MYRQIYLLVQMCSVLGHPYDGISCVFLRAPPCLDNAPYFLGRGLWDTLLTPQSSSELLSAPQIFQEGLTRMKKGHWRIREMNKTKKSEAHVFNTCRFGIRSRRMRFRTIALFCASDQPTLLQLEIIPTMVMDDFFPSTLYTAYVFFCFSKLPGTERFHYI